jgi:putative spermidine/putrescine transport system substrate-binding protein
MKTLIVGAVAALCASMCATGLAGAQTKPYEGVVIDTNSLGGAWDDLITKMVVEPLKEKYGFTVVLHAEPITVSISKLLVDPQHSPYDVFHTDSTTLPIVLATGALEDLDPKFVPEFANVYPRLKEAGNKAAPWFIAPMVIAYRTDAVSRPPEKFSDLARADLKGKVGMYNLENGGGIMDLVALATENGGGVGDIDPGFDALAKIKPNLVVTVAGTTNLVQLLERGEVSVASLWYGRVADMISRGDPIAFVAPKSAAADLEFVSLTKASKHKEAAQLFINALMSPEVGTAIAQRFYNASPNRNVKLPPDVAPKIYGYGEDAVAKLQLLDWKTIAANRGAWAERWNRLMAQ